MEGKELRADLHCHTCFSYDAFSPLWAIARICKLRGIGCLAITDHNDVEGALILNEMVDFKVIVGEEISTRDGDIIGLFLKGRIPAGLSLLGTISAIHEQGGIVYLPHPFDGVPSKKRLSKRILQNIVSQIDVIEGFNARSLRTEYNAKAMSFARENNLPIGAGSDAHTPLEIGDAVVLMDDFQTPQDFIQSVSKSKIEGRRSSLVMRAFLNHNTRKILRNVIFKS